MHTKNFVDFENIRDSFAACPYYDQLNKGILASHSIFNYANFLRFLRQKSDPLRPKNLLILDEGHSIESQFVGQIGLSISRKELRRYIPADILENTTYSYIDDIEKWLPFLYDIFEKILLAVPQISSEEIKLDAINYSEVIDNLIHEIKSNPSNWIVSKIEKENNKVIKVEFKPIDISRYCKKLFEKCNRTVIMSATILDVNTLCRTVGLDSKNVKFVQVDQCYF